MQYAWLIWSLLLFFVWIIVYFSLEDKQNRKKMLVMSLWTSLLGLTEPLFVPAYWSPPSLFDLAIKTGFDIESIIFAFSIGGIVVIIYDRIFHLKQKSVSVKEKNMPRHKYHLLALLTAPVIFVLLLFTNLNPIYSAFIALVSGGVATWYCRPDLKKKMLVSAFLFLSIYFVYFLTLILMYPGYVEKVWNIPAISGIFVFGIPIEELMFALGLGFFWSSIYEHITWHKVVSKESH